MELLGGKLRDRLGGVILGQQPEQSLAYALHGRGVRENLHALAQRGVARRGETIQAFDLDGAEAARAVGFEPVVVAERRYFGADFAQGLVDREPLGELVGRAVDGYLKHGSISVG